MYKDLLTRLDELGRRLARQESSEALAKTQVLLVDGSNTGATAQVQAFTRAIYSPDFLPAISADSDSQQFNANTGSTPTGWTETDAPVSSIQNFRLGYWRVTGSSTNTTWAYQKQVAALVGSSAFNSFALGPCYWRDGRWTGDVTYRFGIYANNAGSPNANVFLRVNLTWDSAAGYWKARGERKDGTTQTDGSWFNLYQVPVVQPVWLRVVVRTTPTINGRCYIGGTPVYEAHTLLQDANANYTWGTPWLVVELSARPASGIENYFYMGAMNRTSDI